MKLKRKKRAVTLIEIMIVILLIGLIGGTLAVNMRGSMEKGKAFKTEQNCNKVYDALMLAYAEGKFDLEPSELSNHVKIKQILSKSPLIKNADQVLKDGWGKPLEFSIVNGDLVVAQKKIK